MFSALSEFDDERQYLVVLCVVEWEFGACQQLRVQFGEVLQHDFVDLQMTFFAQPFAIHHGDEVAKPVCQFLLLFLRVVEPADIFAADTCQTAPVCPYDVLHLPHIEQVFGNIFLAKFL